MRQEKEFFCEKLQPLLGMLWETPIAHIKLRMPTTVAFGDSSLEGMGGYSFSLGFWWHLPFPEESIQQALTHKKDNKDGLLISINILKVVMVIINYCASLHVFTATNRTDDPYPVLLNISNNASPLSWTNHTCRKSKLVCFLHNSSAHSSSTHQWGLTPSG